MFKALIQSLLHRRSPAQEQDISDMHASLQRHQRIFRSSHGYGYFDWDLKSKKWIGVGAIGNIWVTRMKM